MKKVLAVFVAIMFLMPAVALADRRDKGNNRQYNTHHGDKYKPRGHKKRRAHKEDRYAPVHPRYKRGHSHGHRGYRNHYYRRHYTWREWYGSARYNHRHGRYHREHGQMMFSYCDGPGFCFSFSIGN